MNKFLLLLKQQFKIAYNFLRSIYIKQPIYLVTFAISLIAFYYIMYIQITKSFNGLEFAEGINILWFIEYFQDVFLGIVGLIAFFIIVLATKNSRNNWAVLIQLPVKSNSLLYVNIIKYYMFFILIIAYPIIVILISLKASYIDYIQLLFFYVVISLNYIMCFLLLFRFIKFNYSAMIFYLMTILLLLLYTGIMLARFQISKSNEMYNYIISIDWILLFVANKLFKDRQIKFNLIKFTTLKNQDITKNLMKKGKNVYLNIYKIEAKRNCIILVQYLMLQFITFLIIRVLNINIEIEYLLLIIALISGFFAGLHSSYEKVFASLAFDFKKGLCYKLLLSSLVITFEYLVLCLTHANYFSMLNYFNLLLLGCIIFLMTIFTKIPIIKNGEDNAVFYLISNGIPMVYIFFTMIIKHFISELLFINIQSYVLNLVTLLLFVILFHFSYKP